MGKPIVRVADLRQQVYDVLKARITGGEYPPDTKFQEISLAGELGVSRTPVREALAMLVRDGLLEQMVRGFRFPRFSAQEIVEVIEIRQQLEPYAIAAMLRSSDPAEMQALGRQIRAILTGAGDSPAYFDAHREVRALIYAHVRNRQLVAAIGRYEDSIHYLRVSTLGAPGPRRLSYEGMLRLAAAIEAGEAETARELMVQQLANAQKSFLAAVAAEPGATAPEGAAPGQPAGDAASEIA